MVVLNIFSLDDVGNENIIASLGNGTHVIGRGDLLKVRDKRVSRQHAVINVSERNITLTSAHVNPCFFQAAEGRNLTIINKDHTNEIGDGDRFGLLPDSLWFRIKIDRETENNENIDSGQDVEDRLDVTAEPVNIADITTDQLENNEEANDHELDSWEEGNGLKRRITGEVDGECDDAIKKARLTIDEASTSSNNITNNHIQSPKDQNHVQNNKPATSPLSQAESLNLKLDEEDDLFGEGNSQKEKKDSTNNDSASSNNVNNESNRNEASHLDEGLNTSSNMNELSPSITDNNEASRNEASHLDEDLNSSANLNVTANVADLNDVSVENKQETTPDNTAVVGVNADGIKQEELIPSNSQQNLTVKQEPNSATDGTPVVKTDPQDGGVGQNGGDRSASGSATKKRRERCWYAERCFRKNPHHRESFSHPGDQDYASDPEDDRPDCPFGAACYRKNIEHRQEYKHVNRPAPRPTPLPSPPKKKRQTKPKTDGDNSDEESDDYDDDGTKDDTEPSQDTQELKKRRREKAAKKVNLNETPEDDYDLNDPFICDDSSDEFQCDEDDDSDDSEWDDSQVVEEDKKEQKRLLREAKKFKKGK